jgi:hypothetical protein
MWICKNCGKENQNEREHCWNCSSPKGETVVDERPPSPFKTHDAAAANLPISENPEAAHQPSESVRSSPNSSSEASGLSFAGVLKACGVIDLIAGVIGGFYIWSNAPSSYSPSYSYYIGLALAVGFQGVVLFALFNVIAEIAESLRAILHKLPERK